MVFLQPLTVRAVVILDLNVHAHYAYAKAQNWPACDSVRSNLCLIGLALVQRDLTKTKRTVVVLLIFAVVFAGHALSKVTTVTDSKWSIHTAMSILREGNTDLDQYGQLLQNRQRPNRENIIDGRTYTRYPIGASLLAIPFVVVADLYYWIFRGHSYFDVLCRGWAPDMQQFIASFAVALTAVVIFLIAQRRLKSLPKSLLLVFVFAFCTSAWSTASRALWQHGPSMLALAVALYLFVLAEDRPKLVQYAGAVLGFAYVIRPTNSIPIAALSLLVLLRHRPYLLKFLMWGMAIAIPFIAFNYSVYRQPLSPYYLPTMLRGLNLEALVGNLISPSRGLYVFSPVLAFAGLGIGLKLRDRTFGTLDIAVLIVILLHWLMISSLRNWWAGHSIGPRFFTDIIPFFIFFLIPVLERFSRPFTKTKKILAVLFVCLMTVSFLIHYRGANDRAVWTWNSKPNAIDRHPARLWDWSDAQFLRTD